jgi:hypothetical protein
MAKRLIQSVISFIAMGVHSSLAEEIIFGIRLKTEQIKQAVLILSGPRNRSRCEDLFLCIHSVIICLDSFIDLADEITFVHTHPLILHQTQLK